MAGSRPVDQIIEIAKMFVKEVERKCGMIGDPATAFQLVIGGHNVHPVPHDNTLFRVFIDECVFVFRWPTVTMPAIFFDVGLLVEQV
jgi:hypothetical protein